MAKRTDRGLENREIVLDILMEVLERGSFVHMVLNQALDKYQYLDKADRAFITRLTEGTLEYLIQIDAIINQYSKTKTQKMKPVIRIPEGSYYAAVEGSRGEFGVFIESRGDKSPYRMKFRSTGLPLVSCLETIAKGTKIADLIAIGGTLDYVVPDIDR